ncbi:MAG: ACP S-malonyltransferase, partial [Streptomyces sp.]|uniref:ACP S-malonyltransferase n=1 Tax=Streptomyces sp. TaxID=1931 RepID=UPI003D6C6617
HTHHMAPAVDVLAASVEGARVSDPALPYVSNLDGAAVEDGRQVVQRLVNQISAPVRWDQCMETFQKMGVTALIEVCPGGTLTGLAKRGLPGARTLALKTPDDLDAARELIAEHTQTA